MKLTLSSVWMATLVIASVLFSYFYYQFSRNEEILIRQGRRSLQSIHESMLEKEDLYLRITHRIKKTTHEISQLDSNDNSERTQGLKVLLSDFKSTGLQVHYLAGSHLRMKRYGIKGLQHGDSGLEFNVFIDDTTYFTVGTESFMTDIVTTDFFDQIVIFEDDDILYQTDEDFLPLSITDTLLNEQKLSQLGATKYLIEISGQEFRYFVRPIHLQGKQYHLIGFIDSIRFKQERGQVDFAVVGIVFCLLLFLISAIPIIRYLSLGKGDRLPKIRVFECGFSLILMAMVFGLSLGYFSNYYVLTHDELGQLQEESDNLSSAFQGFIQGRTQKLDSLHKDFIKDELSVQNLDRAEYFICINPVSRMMEYIAESRFKINDFPESVADLSHRDYVQVFSDVTPPDVRKQQLLAMDTSGKYFIGSHYSMGNSEFEGVVSRLYGDSISAHTFGFNKWEDIIVRDSLLRSGHHYLIIRSDGLVLYNPNLKNERLVNVIESTDFSGQLAARMESGLEHGLSRFTLKGHDHQVAFSAIPLRDKQKPRFYVLTYFDHDVPAMISSSALALCVAIGILLVILAYALSIVLTAGAYRSSWFKVPPFSYAWFRPSVHLNVTYLKLIGVMLTLMVFLLYSYGRFPLQIFLMGLFCAEILVYIAWIKYAAIYRFRFTENRNDRHPFNKLYTVACWSVMIMLTLMIANYTYSSGKGFDLIFLLWAIQGSFMLLYPLAKPDHLLDRMLHFLTEKSSTTQTAVNIFSMTILIWILLIGYFPTLIITNAAINLEGSIWEEAGKIEDEDDAHLENIGWDEYWDEDFRLFTSMRLRLHNVSGNNSHTNKFHHVNPKWFDDVIWKEEGIGAEEDQGFYAVKFAMRAMGWLAFILLFFWLIRFLVYRIFLVNVLRSKPIEKLDWHEAGYLPEHPSHSMSRIFCMGLSYSGRSKVMNSLFKLDKGKPVPPELALQIDLLNTHGTSQLRSFLDNYPAEGPNHMVIHNLDYLLYRKERLQEFLIEFERAITYNTLNILVYSSSSLNEIFEKIEENRWLYKEGDQSDSETAELIDRLEYLLASFVAIQIPLAHQMESTEQHLLNEYSYGPGLREFEPEPDLNALTPKQADRLIYQIIQYNKAYYLSIWSSLTLLEKHLVHDAAENGYVNYVNRGVLIRLLDKGLFTLDHLNFSVHLFNQSFRYFVLDVVSEQERKGFSILQKRNGNWKNVRILVIVLIAGLVSFMYLTDPTIFNRSIGILSSVAAVLGIIAQTFSGSRFKEILPFLKSKGAGVES